MGSSQRHILVVDDDPVILDALELMLEGYFRVLTAKSGSEARKLIQCHSFDLLLTDYLLDDDRGDRLADYAERGKVPAVLMTGFPQELARCQVACPVLVKPFDGQELLNVLRARLEVPRN